MFLKAAKKGFIFLFLFSICFHLEGWEEDYALEGNPTEHNTLQIHKAPSYVSNSVWRQVAPFLMPSNHPIKEKLDELFSSTRVILSLETLKDAGFKASKPRKFTQLICATHPDFPGYFFKLYVDVQRYHKNKPEYEYWVMRATGAKLVRNEIQKNGWQDLFKVPMKWIYALPDEPSPPSEFLRKNFILVEEDMDLCTDTENLSLWKSDYVAQEQLDALYYILDTVGLHDCVKPENIPFSKDGKVSFIDTQTYNRSVPFSEFTKYLSPKNQAYWKQIIQQ